MTQLDEFSKDVSYRKGILESCFSDAGASIGRGQVAMQTLGEYK